jgi:hypothetical protein
VSTQRGDRFDKGRLVQDLKAIEELGYFDQSNLQAVPEPHGTGTVITIRLQENPPITEFAFEGNSQMSNEALSNFVADQLGKPQNLSQLSRALDKLEAAYHEHGFALARVTNVKDDLDGSIHIQIDEGVINSVQIVGNKKIKDFILKNFIKTKPGTVYDEKTLPTGLCRMYNSGYFQDIRPSLSPSASDQAKYDLKVEVNEKRTWMGSCGLDAMYGPFGLPTLSQDNFKGTGEQLPADTKAGNTLTNQVGSAIFSGSKNLILPARQYQLAANHTHDLDHYTSIATSPLARDVASAAIDDPVQNQAMKYAHICASSNKYIPMDKNKTIALNVQGGAGPGSVPRFASITLGGFNGIRGKNIMFRMPVIFQQGRHNTNSSRTNGIHEYLRFELFQNCAITEIHLPLGGKFLPRDAVIFRQRTVLPGVYIIAPDYRVGPGIF